MYFGPAVATSPASACARAIHRVGNRPPRLEGRVHGRSLPALKRGARCPDSSTMPYLLAVVAASAAGWLCDGAVRPAAGDGGAMAFGFVVSTIVFFRAKQYFTEMRDGR